MPDIREMLSKMMGGTNNPPPPKQGGNTPMVAKKAASPTPAGQRPVPKSPGAGGKARSPSNIQRIKSVEELKLEYGIVRDKKEIPIVDKEELQRDYLVIYGDKSNNSVIIVCSFDSRKQGEIDTKFIAIRRKCSEMGLPISKTIAAQRAVIEQAYIKLGERKNANGIEDEGRVRRDFNNLVSRALSEGVSDVHVEVRRDTAELRFRINGDLERIDEMSVQAAKDMAKVVYNVIAEDKDLTFQPSKQQDAVIDMVVNDTRTRVRLATTPAAPDGFDMVLRILPTTVEEAQGLEELGYYGYQARQIQIGMAQPVGLIVVAGITGSGKSTSLFSMLTQMLKESKYKKKLITVENPVERIIEGATQVSVVLSRDGKDGESPFAKAIRAAMRLDPDILMVGEIRDHDSADLSVDATQSGHQALGTLHAPSAFEVPGRLRSLGVKDDIIGSGDFFSAIVYQSLLQLTCQDCATDYSQWRPTISTAAEKLLDERIQKLFTDEQIDKLVFRNESGCPSCRNGITGREVVAEVITPDNQMREYFRNAQDIKAKSHFLRHGGKTVLQVAIDKVLEGKVDVRDMEKKTNTIDKMDDVFEMSGFPPEHFGFRSRSKNADANLSTPVPDALSMRKKDATAEVVPYRGARDEEEESPR